MRVFPLHAIDFYKPSHRIQYPENTSLVYANFTPRSDSHFNVPDIGIYDKKVVVFGLQYFVKEYLINNFNNEFFNQPKEQVIAKYKRRMDMALGIDSIAVDHIEALHDLGYLPLSIKALPEGTLCPIGIPILIVYNTHPDFYWLTNYIESVMSAYIWKPITCATIANCYRNLLNKYAVETGGNKSFVNFQAHDFSFRGMSGLYDSAICGAAHLTCFFGSDTVLALDLIEEYYNHDETECLARSVPASEHSVMSMGGKDNEENTFRRFLTELYPTGIISIVSDTYDYWKTLSETSKVLYKEIMARPGKLVFRPDSGDPVKIICGDDKAEIDTPQYKGSVEVLWEIFGGTINDKGYKTLDSHIGLIYGDSITIERAYNILEGLKGKGFASDNIVFGIGSYTYQYITRDTFGCAVKATYGIVDNEPRIIFKDPITDSGTKKSARGILCVTNIDSRLTLQQEQKELDIDGDVMRTIFMDGKLLIDDTFTSIRNRLDSQ
jgi:nicotinamide phosphoribosyltransferase